MELVTTILPVLRQRGIIARFFSKKWSLTFHQPELTRKSSLLSTEYSGGNSELQLARYPNRRQFLSMYPVGTRLFSKRYISSNRYQPPEHTSSLPLQPDERPAKDEDDEKRIIQERIRSKSIQSTIPEGNILPDYREFPVIRPCCNSRVFPRIRPCCVPTLYPGIRPCCCDPGLCRRENTLRGRRKWNRPKKPDQIW
ncbi:uncharacterized protein LOC109859738 [Pseudomyrmex gracilis]|uniref:uncharacterized protein LOC109859738 n=1 Tax=Pseudomyrmex gracilis TaxID=219809 RepID=UPI00099566C6|nr:uncharacterized protein LOC109859738 [Pseudomyrmex gracilis]